MGLADDLEDDFDAAIGAHAREISLWEYLDPADYELGTEDPQLQTEADLFRAGFDAAADNVRGLLADYADEDYAEEEVDK